MLISLKHSHILEVNINKKTERIKVYTINDEKYINLKALSIIFPVTYKIKHASGRITITGYGGRKIEVVEGTNIVKGKTTTTLPAEPVSIDKDYYIPLKIIDLDEFKEIISPEIIYITNLEELKVSMITRPLFSRPLISNKDDIGVITFNYKAGAFKIETSTEPSKIKITFKSPIGSNSRVTFEKGVIKEFKETTLKDRTVYTITTRESYTVNLDTSDTKTIVYITKEKSMPKFKITVDPGHGGIDPGAKGYSGTLEKDINLKFSLILYEELKKNGYDVTLTRSIDEFIGLKDRADIANSNGSKLFISIHCNAPYGRKPDVNGFEIYALSEEKIDPEAEAIAAMENEVIKYENITHDRVKEILWGLIRNEYINKSLELAAYIEREVSEIMPSRGVKQAGFYVLRFTQMPAVLVELGYITNKKDEKLLNSEEHLRKMASKIVNGINEFSDAWVRR